MSRLRVGVVGVGHLGRHHARVFAALEGVELAGVADSRLEQARTVAEPLGVPAFADYRELLSRVDAVSIAVPTHLHHEVASAFLDHGISTMVEKPLASSAAEGENLVARARNRGATLQVGHIERFNPVLTALETQRFRPKFISAERLGTYTFRSTDIGVVLDLMIHDIDLILSLNSSPVVAVSAVGVSVFGGHEDVANARLWFEDGCVAELTASRASYQPTRKMRLWGAEGYLTLDFAAKTGTLIRPSDRLRQGELDIEGLDLTQPSAVREHLFGKILRVDQIATEGREPLALELEDFVKAVRNGSRPRVSGDDALRALRVADQVVHSINTHRWEGTADGPIGPCELPSPLTEPNGGIPAPKLWRNRTARKTSGN